MILDVKGFEFNYVRPVAPFYTGSTNTVRATINASFPHLYAAASAVDDALDEFEGMHGTLPGAAAEDASGHTESPSPINSKSASEEDDNAAASETVSAQHHAEATSPREGEDENDVEEFSLKDFISSQKAPAMTILSHNFSSCQNAENIPDLEARPKRY